MTMAAIASERDFVGVYRHYKGNRYRVLGKAKHSETLEEFVVYQALHSSADMWVRPVSMFFENVLADGKCVPRFEKIDGEHL